MELRTLKYFLAVAQEESISKAASDVLFVTQPTLSRQMQELEEELGVKLFERSNKKTILTEDGIHFRKRAEEIVALAERTASEFKDASQQELTGDIFVGGGETDGMRVIAKVFKKFNEKHPQVRLNLFSGNAADVTEKLDQGLLDFGILIEPVNKQKYDYLVLQSKDTWGLLVRRDSELAERKFIKPADLTKIPLIVSRQSFRSNEFSGWLGRIPLNVIATYNLLFNASLMVKEGVGYALCLDKIISTSEDGELKFIPLRPAREVGLVAVYKKGTHRRSRWFFIYGRSPMLRHALTRERSLPPAMVLTRLPVNGLFLTEHGQLFSVLVFLQLIFDIRLDFLRILPRRVNIESSAPKHPASVFFL